MILSIKGNARFAGFVVLLAQAIAAAPAMAGPQAAGTFDTAGFGWAAPVDSAVLRGMTAWTGDEALAPDWSWRLAAFAAFLPSAPGRQMERASELPLDEADILRSGNLPAGLAALGASAASRKSIGDGDSMRLVVQWQESTILREAGGISHATTNVFIDIGVDGLNGLGGIRR